MGFIKVQSPFNCHQLLMWPTYASQIGLTNGVVINSCVDI